MCGASVEALFVRIKFLPSGGAAPAAAALAKLLKSDLFWLDDVDGPAAERPEDEQEAAPPPVLQQRRVPLSTGEGLIGAHALFFVSRRSA